MPLEDPAFRAIFEHAPVGIAVIDAEMRFVDANTAYCEMLGYTKQELLQMRSTDITHPEDRQRDREFVNFLMLNLLPQYRAEKRYLHKDGTTVWGNLTALKIHDEKGGALYTFGIVEDITERKTLRRLLPVCEGCKRIRDDKGYWSEVETYLRNQAGVGVNVGLCPECSQKSHGGGSPASQA